MRKERGSSCSTSCNQCGEQDSLELQNEEHNHSVLEPARENLSVCNEMVACIHNAHFLNMTCDFSTKLSRKEETLQHRNGLGSNHKSLVHKNCYLGT